MEQYRWLPLTKVRTPSTSHTLPRTDLMRAVAHASTTKRFTMLAAPTGAGKTTLAAMTVRTIPAIHTAWLSLDREDNDPSTFLLALVAALQGAIPTIGAWITGAVAVGQVTPQAFTRFMGAMVNELMENDSTPLVLVLDDLHLLTDPTVCAGLNYLLERMPPHLHLLATTRYDPPLALARLRAQGELAEFRLGQLLFTTAETAQLLNDHLGLTLSAQDIHHIQRRSEGWIAGVRLLALSLGQIAPARRSDFLAQLTTQEQYVFDLLAEEVLAQQSDEIREFLLATSILRDLTPDLCRHITQRHDAPDLLASLYRRNLFLMAVDTENAPRIYRYHALFHDFLRQRLAQESLERVRTLHLRAAEVSPAPQALHHYIQAQAWEAAATLLGQIGQEALWQGRYGVVRDWLSGIPETIRADYPWLLFLDGFLHYHAGDMHRAYALLQTALAKFEAQGNQEGAWETMGALAGDVLQAFNPEGQQYYLSLCQRLLASPIRASLRGRVLIGLAWWNTFVGNWDSITRYVEEAMTICRTANDLQTYGAVIPHLSPPFFAMPQGRERISRFYHEFLERHGDSSPLAVWAYLVLATATFAEGNWREMRKYAALARHAAERSSITFYWSLNYQLYEIFVAATEGDSAQLPTLFQNLITLLQVPLGYSVIYSVLGLHSYFAWLLKDTATLQNIEIEMGRIRTQGFLEDLHGNAGDKLVDGMIALVARRYTDAEALLLHVVEQQEFNPESRFTVPDARVVLVHLYLTQRQRAKATDIAESTLRFYETRGEPGMLLRHGDGVLPLLELGEEIPALRPFVAHVRTLWAELREGRTLALPDSDERLTPREVEVLELLGKGASNRDIAEYLVVTERTVKSHVTNILSKMGVTSRAQAVARARELHLL